MVYLDHMIVLFLVFQARSILFSIEFVLINILTISVKEFFLLYILTSIYYFFNLFFYNSHSNWGKMKFHCSSDFYFPDG